MEESRKSIKAIVLDKDGTIFDYSKIWLSVIEESLDIVFEKERISNKNNSKQLLLKVLGFDEDGNTVPNGIIFANSKFNIFYRMCYFSLKSKIKPSKIIRMSKLMSELNTKLIDKKLKTIDFSKQQALFKKLHEKNYKIGIITVDNSHSLKISLNRMGIEKYIDFTSTKDDHLPNKPNPKSFNVFCSKFNLDPQEVAFVGDTKRDMIFAKKAKSGYKVGVLWGSNDIKNLSKYSDTYYNDLFGLLDDPIIF